MEQQKLVITEKKKEMLSQMPNLETKISKSKDGKWIIITTSITKIYSRAYFDKVLSDDSTEIEDL